MVDRIGRAVGLLDGDEREESTGSVNGTDMRLDELLHAQQLVRHELERLVSAQAQMNEIVGALIEGLGELTRLQTATRVVDGGSRLERIIVAQDRMTELLELALGAGFDDEERPRLR